MHQKSVILITIGTLSKIFNYKPYLCNVCHDLTQKAMNFNDVDITHVEGNDYRIHFWYVSKDDAISVLINSNLSEESRSISLLYLKMSETTYYQRNRDLILGRAKRYYENDKERLRDKARDKYKELSKEEKIYKKKIWKKQIL